MAGGRKRSCIHNGRAVARAENLGGGLVVLGGENVLPLVEIGLTDLPNKYFSKEVFF